ncbi:hypothetical protein PoB_006137900 [Plakobranchus ocellatus]|uniref:Uncharacterized protein n=1 Tax=Plakobranchus ocellatus TaxID=259542 RepID=A0AAV4CSP5_9GAST|nr:hypothetical protein PoB_006137900 [Plakobranchus ocellatus]
MKTNFAAGPSIGKAETRAAKKQVKMRKATGSDNIAVGQIEALKDFGIEKSTSLLNEANDAEKPIAHMKKSIFLAFRKNAGTTESE